MKTQTKSLLFIFIAWFAFVTAVGQPNDIAAIKEVIAKETESFMAVNKQGWADCWLKAPYVYWSYSDSTSTSFVEGWDGPKGFEKTFETYFKTAKPSKATITNNWLDIKVYGNGAYARFVQVVKAEIDHDETSQVRVLEKKDGQWKVICVGAVAKYPVAQLINH